MNPEQAVRAFLELKANVMVPMHYGTFRLSFEPPEEPLERLKAEVKRNDIEDKIVIMDEGIPKVF
jgi:L-ascorbate metabolism protein UlaG (beta-lactamase superfamily)